MGNNDKDIQLEQFEKADDAVIRITLSTYGGRQFLNARLWIRDRESYEWKPTKQGVTFRPNELERLQAAISKARKMLQQGEEDAA